MTGIDQHQRQGLQQSPAQSENGLLIAHFDPVDAQCQEQVPIPIEIH